MNPVLIFIPVAAAIVLFFLFKPKKKEEASKEPSEPVINYPIAFDPAPVAEGGAGDPVEVQPEEVAPVKPKKAPAKKKVPIKK